MTHDPLCITTDTYSLRFDPQRLLAWLEINDADLYYAMSLLCAVDTVQTPDRTDTISIGPVTEHADHCQIDITHESTVWNRKTVRYRCYNDRLSVQVILEGRKQAIDRLYYGRGNYGGQELASMPGYDVVFSGCPNFLEKNYFHASDYCSINCGLETYAWGPALSSGPLCFAFSTDVAAPWLGVGIAAKPGAYGFQSYEYNHKPQAVLDVHDSIVGTQALSLAYYGHEKVDGTWESPCLMFNVADDKHAVIADYVEQLYAEGLLNRPDRSNRPDWWRKPIFCGWHEQVATALAPAVKEPLSMKTLETGTSINGMCTQENYTRWLDVLESRGIKPGAIILDAMWQVARDDHHVDTDKWPDLRGFINDRHARGQKVILWIDTWKRGTLPDAECLTIDGAPICHDPTHPAFMERLKKEIHFMLSDEAGCVNADGFKIDGTSQEPFGYGMKTHGDLYGFELQKHFIALIHNTAKAVKPEAMISLFIGNPYFAEVCDAVRVGDMYTTRADPRSAMFGRAAIFKLAMAGALIDTDGQLRFCLRDDYRDLLDDQLAVGVPTLYNAELLMRRRALAMTVCQTMTDADYAAIRKTLEQYYQQEGLEP